jgi:hypothetical protein
MTNDRPSGRVLVALLDPTHRNYEDAHRWLGCNRGRGSATWPFILKDLCSAADYRFWVNTVSLLYDALFTATAIAGYSADHANHDRLATFDRSIPLKAIRGASAGNLALIETIIQ